MCTLCIIQITHVSAPRANTAVRVTRLLMGPTLAPVPGTTSAPTVNTVSLHLNPWRLNCINRFRKIQDGLAMNWVKTRPRFIIVKSCVFCCWQKQRVILVFYCWLWPGNLFNCALIFPWTLRWPVYQLSLPAPEHLLETPGGWNLHL